VEPAQLVDAVLGALPAALRTRFEEMRATMTEQLTADRQAEPALPIDDHLLATAVAHIVRRPDIESGVARFRLGDVALATWAVSNDAGIAAFERRHRATIDKVVARFRTQQPDELRQRLRVRLFVSAPGVAPRLAEYSGFGFLQNWLKVTALRAFVDVTRSEAPKRNAVELDDLLADDKTSPTGAVARAQLQQVVKVAFAAAVAELAPRERIFLRHTLIDHHTLDQVAAAYAVHRATVARVLSQAKESIMTAMRTTLTNANEPDINHVLTLLSGNIDLSLSRVLRVTQD
jgi:RNA polymerase sigma-70 factor, ECF subfamily